MLAPMYLRSPVNAAPRRPAVIPDGSRDSELGGGEMERPRGRTGVPGRDISGRPVVGSRGRGTHGPGIDIASGSGRCVRRRPDRPVLKACNHQSDALPTIIFHLQRARGRP